MARCVYWVILVFSISALGQTPNTKPVRKKPVNKSVSKPASKPPREAKPEEPAVSVPAPKKPVKRFSLAYFGETHGPALKDGDKYRVRTSVATGNRIQGNRPWNTWNQFSFRYKLDSGYEPFFNPRFETQWTTTSQYTDPDQSQIRVLDPVTGVRKFWDLGDGLSFFMQASYGVPIQKSTRADNRDGFFDCFCTLDYAPKGSKWIFGSWILPRYYLSGAASKEFWFLYVAPYVGYTINDRWQPQIYFEQELEHFQTKGAERLNYATRVFQGAFVGVNYIANPSLVLYPYIRMNALQKPALDTASIGLWVIGMLY
jgi:hypothetical protein